MQSFHLFRRLLLILAVAGLVLSPVVLPTQAAAMSGMSAMQAMPCCDVGLLAPACKAACPLATACHSDYAPGGSLVEAGVLNRGALVRIRLPSDETSLENLGARPLSPPPRI